MTRIRPVPSRPWQLASTACAITAAVAMAFVPTGSEQSSASATVDSAGNLSGTAITTAVTHNSLYDVQGPSVLLILAIPVALTLIGLLTPARVRQVTSLVSLGLLGLFTAAVMLSVGLFFVPAIACSIVAIARGQGPAQPTAPGNALPE